MATIDDYKKQKLMKQMGIKMDENNNERKEKKLNYFKVEGDCKYKFVFLGYPFKNIIELNDWGKLGALMESYNMYNQGFLFNPELWNKENIFLNKMNELKNKLIENKGKKINSNSMLWKKGWRVIYSVEKVFKLLLYAPIYILDKECNGKKEKIEESDRVKILILSETMINTLEEQLKESELKINDLIATERIVLSIKREGNKRNIFVTPKKVKMNKEITLPSEEFDILNFYRAPSENEQLSFLKMYVNNYINDMPIEIAEEILKMIGVEYKKEIKVVEEVKTENENIDDDEFTEEDITDFFETNDGEEELPF